MYQYSHHIGDFDRATRHLSRLERSIYRDLMDLYYITEMPLTNDIGALCRRILANSEPESTAVQQVLNEFFTKTQQGWFNNRCEEVISDFHKNSTAKSIAGKASAAKREQERRERLENLNIRSTDVQQPLDSVATDIQQIANEIQLTVNPKPVNHKKEIYKEKDEELFSGVDSQVVADFKACRALLKAKITKTAIDGIKREAGKAGFSFEEALRTCCERGWKGFKAEWVTSKNNIAPELGDWQ